MKTNKDMAEYFTQKLNEIQASARHHVSEAIAAHSIPEGEWLKFPDDKWLRLGEDHLDAQYINSIGHLAYDLEDPYGHAGTINMLDIYQLIELLSLIPDVKTN